MFGKCDQGIARVACLLELRKLKEEGNEKREMSSDKKKGMVDRMAIGFYMYRTRTQDQGRKREKREREIKSVSAWEMVSS